MIFKKIVGGLLFLLLTFNIVAINSIKEGVDYTVIDKKIKINKNKPINVKEFFSFSCIHCKELEPLLDEYQVNNLKKIELQRIHVVWGDDQIMLKLAQLNATISIMGKSKELNPLVFAAIFMQNNLTDMDLLKQFLKKNKIDENKFMAIYNSFEVNKLVATYKALTSNIKYNISGTPTVIVDDKYIISPAVPSRIIEVLNYLIKNPK
jgi:thiol:disulfide interchange protein DsbA